MIRTMKFSLLLMMLLTAADAFALQANEMAQCYLTKIEQEFPNDAIPAIGVVEFSNQKITVPVQFFGEAPAIWESSLTADAKGALSGNHFWNIHVFRDNRRKINRLTLEFENPSNSELYNEETSYSAEFYCASI